MDFTILHFAIHIVWRANVICTCRKSGIARKTTVAYPELRLLGGYPDNFVKMWNPDKPSTKFEYVFKLSNLTHGLQYELKKELYINTEHVQDFEIEWCIADSSLLEHKHGKLRVIVSDKNKTDE